MNAIIILNSQAGSLAASPADAATPANLQAAFVAAGMEVSLQMVTGAAIDAALLTAVAQRPDAIVVGGGDGTMSAAAARLADTRIPLGVLPLGTLNHFARDLGVPTDWRDAAVALARSTVQAVDVGEVNGRVFINNCSIGAYAEAVRRRDLLRRRHGHGKWPAMFLAGLSVFWELRRIRLRIDLPDAQFEMRTPFLIVANNRYSGHVLESSLRSRLDEGRLWFYRTRARGHADMVRLVWQSLVRQLDAVDALDVRSAPAATVDTKRTRVPVAADGELINVQPPLRFRIRPLALRVLAPPKSTGATAA